jgi:hypothetical protein
MGRRKPLVVIASLILSGILLLLYETYRRLEPRAIFPMTVYLLLCNTFESFAGRFVNFTIFIVMVSALCRRQDASASTVT